MKHSHSDSRSGTVVFACHCLLNANAKVRGLAKYAGMHQELIEALSELNIGVIQLPCPELLHMGPDRWWQTRSQYQIPSYLDLCHRLAEDAANQATLYSGSHYTVLGLLGIEGSPSCGVNEVYDAEDWGGCPREVDLTRCKAQGTGVFIQALNEAFAERSLNIPVIGLSAAAENVQEQLAEILKNKPNS